MRLVVALVGLTISFALPAFAQQTNTVDPKLREALDAFLKKEDETYLNGDAAALAALYTEDAVLVNDSGPFTVGRLSRNGMQTRSSKFISPLTSTRPIRILSRSRNG